MLLVTAVPEPRDTAGEEDQDSASKEAVALTIKDVALNGTSFAGLAPVEDELVGTRPRPARPPGRDDGHDVL
jgi:hypothetical protein